MTDTGTQPPTETTEPDAGEQTHETEQTEPDATETTDDVDEAELVARRNR